MPLDTTVVCWGSSQPGRLRIGGSASYQTPEDMKLRDIYTYGLNLEYFVCKKSEPSWST